MLGQLTLKVAWAMAVHAELCLPIASWRASAVSSSGRVRVQRNLKVAQALGREAEQKRGEAVRLAREFDAAKNAAREAGQVRTACFARCVVQHLLRPHAKM